MLRQFALFLLQLALLNSEIEEPKHTRSRVLATSSATTMTRHSSRCVVDYSAVSANVFSFGGTRWRSWLRHCSTSRNIAGSIPDGVTEIFH